MARRNTAWVVRWDWAGDHAKVKQPIAAILPSQLGPETVRRLVETLYAAREYTPAEMLEASRRNGFNPYRATFGSCPVTLEDGSTTQATWQGEVLCGHNPYLVARKAIVRSVGDDEGSVVFEDTPRPAIDMRGWQPASEIEL
jgi:hypothetical protein